jgi:hypothetical protein
MKKRIVGQTLLITATNGCDLELKLRIVPMIPSLRGQHFAAKPVSLVSLHDRTVIATSGLLESYGVTEADAAYACTERVEQFLATRT